MIKYLERMWKNLKSPTPKKMRRIGNAFAAFSTSLAACAYVMENPTLSIICVIVGALGRGMVEFFTEEQ